jgi:radical SAM-linked protein
MAYTQGFHPKPDMSFGPALSLGIASLDEHVDVKLIDAPAPEELLARLQREESGGLRFVEVVRLAAAQPKLSRVLTGAHYVIGIAQDVVCELGGRARLQERIDAFLAKDEVVVRRTIKGIGKRVNVRHYVEALSLDEGGLAQLAVAGIVGELVPLSVRVLMDQTGAVKMTEVLTALFEREDVPHLAVRTALLAGSQRPLNALPETPEPSAHATP